MVLGYFQNLKKKRSKQFESQTKMNKLIILITLCLAINLTAQISEKDSTVQVVGYWDLNEIQSFELSFDKYKIKQQDTTYTMKANYDVDITIKDSTQNSYLIEWHYKNYKIESDNELIKKLSKVAENLSVLIQTDELGVFQEVKNWKEIAQYINKSISILKEEFKNVPGINKIIEQTTMIYGSKEGIESNAIKDIQQFYYFHGVKYSLGEKLTGTLKTKNNYGENDFDTEVEFSLDEINFEDGNSILRMYNAVDSKQLTDATFGYLKELEKIAGKDQLKRDDIPPLKNETWAASRIHGETGWVIYSILTKEVSAENTTNVEETIINLK